MKRTGLFIVIVLLLVAGGISRDIRDQDDERLADRINQKRQGDSVSMTIWRDGEELSKQVQLGQFDGT
ncbi:MAG: hypothetical protein UU81_C0026G0024 [Microgenomates group bacterium GW2011_GWC1_41_8]|uniref:Uncharacterized protein n=2 Tax=Candidatus Roizmaniibacteriota TaxID=1752723 RepID=A0A0G0VJK1_9BACT|nr:MAG: hypothetical protein UU14_C0011G0025 [Candidatus Roizmanbacteria bacterium GW2011_GWB1_40_7]KKR94342.1 MAG: hypothetical protein UU41_C0008G0026 [Candidatus Roizmanbacteria bacterium GW2011_GWA1_41_13]KKS23553.1 MAG: hypothetical protein UU81_C0026G0024 [Microgenomates group bacterium GW2011_GWC1_41_8]OGK50262.1 MAG: hypothetical protein A3A55_01680 [Candidatus Roizmanbacteria bacterium RIFCSPLOWO2_01_FULL_40_14]